MPDQTNTVHIWNPTCWSSQLMPRKFLTEKPDQTSLVYIGDCSDNLLRVKQLKFASNGN